MRVASHAASASAQVCSVHISAGVFIENFSLYYLSVKICVATIQNLQPLDGEKLFVNMGVPPRK